MTDKVPTCPKCGTPARVVIVRKARVRCVLQSDGTVGEVISASRTNESVIAYECGGGHVWSVVEEKDE
jgi:hypothetical protein